MNRINYLNQVLLVFRWLVVGSLLLQGLIMARNATAETIEVEGVAFPVSYQSGEVKLELRGAAVLRWARLVDLYAGAFYLPAGVDASKWGSDVDKHLELCYFREIPAKGFIEASQDHLQDNLPADRLGGLQARLNDLYKLFKDVGPGDRYILAYTPDVGTVLKLNGEPLGTIPGADFAEAYFGIWLGESPLNKRFRDQVLGISSS